MSGRLEKLLYAVLQDRGGLMLYLGMCRWAPMYLVWQLDGQNWIPSRTDTEVYLGVGWGRVGGRICAKGGVIVWLVSDIWVGWGIYWGSVERSKKKKYFP